MLISILIFLIIFAVSGCVKNKQKGAETEPKLVEAEESSPTFDYWLDKGTNEETRYEFKEKKVWYTPGLYYKLDFEFSTPANDNNKMKKKNLVLYKSCFENFSFHTRAYTSSGIRKYSSVTAKGVIYYYNKGELKQKKDFDVFIPFERYGNIYDSDRPKHEYQNRALAQLFGKTYATDYISEGVYIVKFKYIDVSVASNQYGKNKKTTRAIENFSFGILIGE